MHRNYGFSEPNEGGYFARFDGSMAGGENTEKIKALILGQRLAAGTVAKDTKKFIASESAGRTFFGQGSMIARAIEAFRRAYPLGETWAIAQDEPSAGVAAVGSILCAATNSQTGTIEIEIGGQDVFCGVVAGDVANTIATNLAAAINAVPNIPVVALASTATVSLTAKWKGITGNNITIRVNPEGEKGGQRLPGGVTLTVTAMGGTTPGSGAPDLTASLALIANGEFDIIVNPYGDATSLGDLAALKVSHWSPEKGIFGHVVSAYDASYSDLITYSGTSLQNDPHMTMLIGSGVDMPRPPWERAALLGAVTAREQCDGTLKNLAQGFTEIELPGDIPPTEDYLWEERNILGGYGFATCYSSGGKVYLSRARTTYITDESGEVDPAYRDQRTLMILQRMTRQDRIDWKREFQGAALIDDDQDVGDGAKVLSESIGKAWFAGQYESYRKAGLVTDVDAFMDALSLTISSATGVRVTYPPTISGWLNSTIVDTQFRLGGGN